MKHKTYAKMGWITGALGIALQAMSYVYDVADLIWIAGLSTTIFGLSCMIIAVIKVELTIKKHFNENNGMQSTENPQNACRAKNLETVGAGSLGMESPGAKGRDNSAFSNNNKTEGKTQ